MQRLRDALRLLFPKQQVECEGKMQVLWLGVGVGEGEMVGQALLQVSERAEKCILACIPTLAGSAMTFCGSHLGRACI